MRRGWSRNRQGNQSMLARKLLAVSAVRVVQALSGTIGLSISATKRMGQYAPMKAIASRIDVSLDGFPLA
jgi:hypothetical protein